MDKFVITKNEWHYKLLRLLMRSDFAVQYSCKDFCSYWRAFVIMLLCASGACTILAGVLSYLVFSTIYTLILNPFYGWISAFEHQFFVGTILTGIFSFVASIVFLWRRYSWGSKLVSFIENMLETIDDWAITWDKRKWDIKEELQNNPPQPSLFRQWLRNTRDKVCVGIEYVNEK